MPISVANTTLSLSQIDQLREIVLQTNAILGTTIDPFSLQNLNKSDWWQYEFARQVLSTTLVAEGYPALPEFSISDLNNGQLPIVLIEKINASLSAGGSTVLLLVPTGAVETVDGEYQRFTHDGTYTASVVEEGVTYLFPMWYADLPPHSSYAFQVAFKLPQGRVDLYIANAEFNDMFLLGERPFNRIELELRSEGLSGAPSSGIGVIDHATPANSVYASFDIMPAGSLVVLNISSSSIDYVSPVANGSLPIPANFFSTAPNVIVCALPDDSDVVPTMSIKVQSLSGA